MRPTGNEAGAAGERGGPDPPVGGAGNRTPRVARWGMRQGDPRPDPDLLVTKLFVPLPRGAVARPRLLARLDEAYEASRVKKPPFVGWVPGMVR